MFNKIEAIEVDRETEKQVLLPANNGYIAYRENKRSYWSNWHDTLEDAQDFLLNEIEEKRRRLKDQLNRLEDARSEIKNMTKGQGEMSN